MQRAIVDARLGDLEEPHVAVRLGLDSPGPLVHGSAVLRNRLGCDVEALDLLQGGLGRLAVVRRLAENDSPVVEKHQARQQQGECCDDRGLPDPGFPSSDCKPQREKFRRHQYSPHFCGHFHPGVTLKRKLAGDRRNRNPGQTQRESCQSKVRLLTRGVHGRGSTLPPKRRADFPSTEHDRAQIPTGQPTI